MVRSAQDVKKDMTGFCCSSTAYATIQRFTKSVNDVEEGVGDGGAYGMESFKKVTNPLTGKVQHHSVANPLSPERRNRAITTDGSGEEIPHTLLNVMAAPEGSKMKLLGLLFSRLDNLSHVLFWSYEKLDSPSSASCIDLVEVSKITQFIEKNHTQTTKTQLPRIKMKFKAQNVSGQIRLYSTDHDGLYITTNSDKRKHVERLLGNVPHFVVMQNSDEDLFALVPGCALPRRLYNDGCHLSTAMIMDRRNGEWIDNLGEVRCYLYPVHPSHEFLYTPSLACSLYLLLIHFIAGNYIEVFKMIESCVSEELSAEELQIFDQLEFLGNDCHPDAHACRLKFSAVVFGFDGAMKCPWSIVEELMQYVRKHEHVSAPCRLTVTEEMSLLNILLERVGGGGNGGGNGDEEDGENWSCSAAELVEFKNRFNFISAVGKLEMCAGECALTDRTVVMALDSYPTIDNFDSVEDQR